MIKKVKEDNKTKKETEKINKKHQENKPKSREETEKTQKRARIRRNFACFFARCYHLNEKLRENFILLHGERQRRALPYVGSYAFENFASVSVTEQIAHDL